MTTTMHRRDYFLQALKLGNYRHKRWVIECFSVTRGARRAAKHDFSLQHDEIGAFFEKNGEKVYLEGVRAGEPAYHFRDEVVVGPGDLSNVTRNITTTYGNVLFNQIALVYPFGGKIPFIEGAVDVGQVEKIIEARLMDDPAEGLADDPHALYVREYKRFNEAMGALAGYSQLCVAAATAKSMTTDPQIRVRRAELLEKHKERLHDPVVQAEINNELIAMDRAWIKGDESEGFFIKSKSFDVVRKKLLLLQGAEQGFGVDGDVIPVSLSEGWDIRHLPAMGNALRDGSYNRGAQTALGGEATKFNYRIFQNTVVMPGDCGTQLGLRIRLTPKIASRFIGSSVITPKGPFELTAENVKVFHDKQVLVRSPIYCKEGDANFCSVCIGRKIASTPSAVSTYAADIGSMFMLISMKAMHGKTLSVAKWDPFERIT